MTHQTPVLLADPHKDVAPHTYVVQVNTSKCQNCGHEGRSFITFAKTHFKARWDRKYVSNMRPLREGPKYNLPVEIIHAPTENTPFCHECSNLVELMAKFPYPPMEVNLSKASDPDTTIEKVAKPSKKKPVVTTDDLMEGLDL